MPTAVPVTNTAAIATAATTPSLRSSARDPWPDNARFIAATLILIMHFADGPIPDNAVIAFLGDATWPMRIPLYALIAGYF